MTLLQVVFYLVTPATVGAVIVSGIFLTVFLRQLGLTGPAGTVFLAVLIVGWSFIAAFAAARAVEGARMWEVYIGAGLLWGVYSASAAISVRVWTLAHRRRP